MLSELSHQEWQEWVWFIEKNGIPESNADGRMMDLIIHLTNINSDAKQKRNEFVYFTKEKLEGGSGDGHDPQTYEQRLETAALQMKAMAGISGNATE